MLLPRAERDRLEQRAGAEADVGVPHAALAGDPQQQVAAVADGAGRGGPPDAGEHRLHLEAQLLQGGGEQQVVLEAVPAPPAVDDLALEV